jgi:ribose 5-phosphate isomerase B
MKIAIGSDHAGFEAKDAIVKQVGELGHQVQDLGVNSPDSVDYPEYAHIVAAKVADGQAELGILVCGSGIGMSIAANKVSGVRAALCGGEYAARMSRQHNDANILCLGARVTGADLIESMVRIFLATSFEGGRHQVRVDKMESSGVPKN